MQNLKKENIVASNETKMVKLKKCQEIKKKPSNKYTPRFIKIKWKHKDHHDALKWTEYGLFSIELNFYEEYSLENLKLLITTELAKTENLMENFFRNCSLTLTFTDGQEINKFESEGKSVGMWTFLKPHRNAAHGIVLHLKTIRLVIKSTPVLPAGASSPKKMKLSLDGTLNFKFNLL